jgi:hypothetical protein
MKYTVAAALLAALTFSFPAVSDSEEPAWLFVQNAESATVSDGMLTLEGVSPVMLAFTDRPDRMVFHLETQDFAEDVWNDGENSFAADPPNAVLVYREGSQTDSVVLELSDLTMVDGDTLAYSVSVLDGDLPSAMEDPHLVIDSTGGAGGRGGLFGGNGGSGSGE